MSTGECPMEFNFDDELAPFISDKQIKHAEHQPADDDSDIVIVKIITLEDTVI